MTKVRCNDCYWLGEEDDLVIKDNIEHCPKCNKTEALMDNPVDERLTNPPIK